MLMPGMGGMRLARLSVALAGVMGDVGEAASDWK